MEPFLVEEIVLMSKEPGYAEAKKKTLEALSLLREFVEELERTAIVPSLHRLHVVMAPYEGPYRSLRVIDPRLFPIDYKDRNLMLRLIVAGSVQQRWYPFTMWEVDGNNIFGFVKRIACRMIRYIIPYRDLFLHGHIE